MTLSGWIAWAVLGLGLATLTCWTCSKPRPRRGVTLDPSWSAKSVAQPPAQPATPTQWGLAQAVEADQLVGIDGGHPLHRTPPTGPGAGSQGSTPRHCPGCICDLVHR